MNDGERMIVRRYALALAEHRWWTLAAAAGKRLRLEAGIGPDHPLLPALARLAEAHKARCEGKSSPAECDAVLNEVLR